MALTWRLLTIMAFVTFTLMNCTDRKTEPFVLDDTTASFGYYPLQIGKYLEYVVDSVVYDFAVDGSSIRDSSRTFIRESVADSLRDNEGNLAYKIERYERQAEDFPWQIKHVWWAVRTESEAIRVEQNLRFVKMIFPMDAKTVWDGNRNIDIAREIEIAGEKMRPFSNWKYQVDSIDVAGTVGSFAFDSLLVISEADENNVIERRFSRSKYAKNIGLVWREMVIFDSQYCNQSPPPTDCQSKPWEEKAEKGYLLRQWILRYN